MVPREYQHEMRANCVLPLQSDRASDDGGAIDEGGRAQLSAGALGVGDDGLYPVFVIRDVNAGG